MEGKHWYIIVNEKDHPIVTTDREEVEKALRKKHYGVTEVKEHTLYLENALVQTIVHSQLKKPERKKGK